MGGQGMGGASAGTSVAALMRRGMSPAEALLITGLWSAPPRSPAAPDERD